MVRQIGQRGVPDGVDADDHGPEAALAGVHQGERLGPWRHGNDARHALEAAGQVGPLGQVVAHLGIVEIRRMLHLRVAGHEARGGVDPGVVGARLERHADGYESDREADAGGGHPGSQTPTPEISPGNAHEQRAAARCRIGHVNAP